MTAAASVHASGAQGIDRQRVQLLPHAVGVSPQSRCAEADDILISRVAVEVGDDQALTGGRMQLGSTRWNSCISHTPVDRPEIDHEIGLRPAIELPGARARLPTFGFRKVQLVLLRYIQMP